MIVLKSNEYWGKRGGKVMRDGSLGIQQQQWGCGRNNSEKRRKVRVYANPKLHKRGRNG